jgi:S1-C subfamily serine protease
MSWVDVVIVVIVLAQGVRGGTRGALAQLGGIAGAVAGFVAGVLVAPAISSAITHAHWRALLAVGIVVAGSVIGSLLGALLASFVRRSLNILRVGIVDSVAGVAMGVVEALLVCWLFAGLLTATPWSALDQGIQQSRIMVAMDRVMPTPSSIAARVQSLFRFGDFPGVFASVVAPTLPGSAPSTLGRVVRSLAAPSNVVKVLASGGCPHDRQGTAFFVSEHVAVTNAHVVAGAARVSVDGANARVVGFDPRNDIAVLRVSSRSEAASAFATTAVRSGTAAEVVGFPLDATRTGAPAIVRGKITAEGRDIYDSTSFRRTVLVVNAQVKPGNSGSPVLVGSRVVGVIFANSYGQRLTAYAVPADVAHHDVARASSRPVSTQSCLS